MTGFGAAERSEGDVTVGVELRSVNHRHLDVRFRPSTGAPALEARLLAGLRKALQRGHLEVRIHLRAAAGASSLRVDVERAKAWHQAIDVVSHALHLIGSVTALDIVTLSGVVDTAATSEVLQDHADLVAATLDDAIAALVDSRTAEGDRLVADLQGRLAHLSELAGSISGLAAGVLSKRREALRERVQLALSEVGATADPARLEQELVHIADRTDITEELVRLRSHLQASGDALASEATPGRKLGFLAQEILRELNTVGSKSSDVAITNLVVAAKVEVEKLREQILNLE